LERFPTGILDSFLSVKGCGVQSHVGYQGWRLVREAMLGHHPPFRIPETEVNAQKIAPEWRKKQGFLHFRAGSAL